MPLDQASSAFIAQMLSSGARPLYELTPPEARENSKAMRALFGPAPALHKVEDVRVKVADGSSLRIRLLAPGAEPKGVIAYFHGGGWVLGEIEQFETLAAKIALASGCTVALVDYRLAPEYPFPIPVEDSYTALEWIDANLVAIAGRRVPLIVGGDSAGANLATVAARRARDNNGPRIAAQVLVYPVTDCDLENASYMDPQCQALLSRESMVWFWDAYIAAASDRRHPDASPLHASSLAGLPPALVLTAECDPLRDEGEAYAAALIKAGVAVEFKRYDGQMHGFFTMVNVLPGSAVGIEHVARFVAGHV
jgi:acetyl esterase